MRNIVQGQLAHLAYNQYIFTKIVSLNVSRYSN